MLVESLPWPRISYWQGYKYLQSTSGRYFVLQMTRKDSTNAYQLAILEQSSRIAFFKNGIAPYWIPSLEAGSYRDQSELLEMAHKLCLEHTSIMSLRIHAYIPGDPALEIAELLLRESGYGECEQQAPTKTRIIDLRPPINEILAQFPAKVRTKLKLKKPEEIRVSELNVREHLAELQSALNDSFSRSSAQQGNYDFESLSKTLENSPGEAAALGLFLSDNFGIAKAFITGVASFPLFEYTAAGSRSEARLRQFPFNYILLWRLVEIAKVRGSLLFDMGGITDGGPDDPLAGISDFKRRFPGFEMSIGRERLLIINTLRWNLFVMLQGLKNLFS